MARGFPDFFGTSIFPTFGNFEEAHYSSVGEPSLVAIDAITITGKGIVRGGHGHFESGTEDGDALYFVDAVIDGATSIPLATAYPDERYNVIPAQTFAKIENIEYEDSRVEFHLTGEIPFTTSFVLRITPQFTTGPVLLQVELYYSLYA